VRGHNPEVHGHVPEANGYFPEPCGKELEEKETKTDDIG